MSRYISEATKRQVRQQARGLCRYCGKKDYKGTRFEYDHIVPHSKGGESTVNNLQYICQKCNRRKGADDDSAELGRVLKELGKVDRLYKPDESLVPNDILRIMGSPRRGAI